MSQTQVGAEPTEGEKGTRARAGATPTAWTSKTAFLRLALQRHPHHQQPLRRRWLCNPRAAALPERALAQKPRHNPLRGHIIGCVEVHQKSLKQGIGYSRYSWGKLLQITTPSRAALSAQIHLRGSTKAASAQPRQLPCQKLKLASAERCPKWQESSLAYTIRNLHPFWFFPIGREMRNNTIELSWTPGKTESQKSQKFSNFLVVTFQRCAKIPHLKSVFIQ